jgi:hypothetical protein
MSNIKTVKDIAIVCDKVATYELSLIKTYGALIYGHDLWKVIGYPSSDAFRQAVKRKSVPVPTFKREGYRMRFARSHDVAVWLASMDYQQN